jgi:hypothetical protein
VRRIVRLCAAIVAATAVTMLAATPAFAATMVAQRPHPHRQPWPITITVQTVPAVAQVQFKFDGKTLITNAAGRASYSQEHNLFKHSLSLVTTSVDLPDRRYRFARWAGQRDPNQAFRTSIDGLPMRASYTVTAAFSVQYPVNAAFVDQNGHPLDLSHVSAAKIKNDAGEILDLPKNGTIWLAGQIPNYRNSGMVVSDVSYSLQSIVMNGTNIVDAGRQRFVPAKAPAVTFTGQLHNLTVTANDALYRDTVGGTAVVTYPDGSVRRMPFGSDHTAAFSSLPRGTYKVSVEGAKGIVLDEQVSLSRDKVLTVGVLTVGDLTMIGVAGLMLASALLLIGRLRRQGLRALALGLRWVRSLRRKEVATE